MILPLVWCYANNVYSFDGHGSVLIKGTNVQGTPKDSSIQATINGHVLSVVFLDDLGEVVVEVTDSGGGDVEATCIQTPNGVNFYITFTGSYIVTFTLPNGDEYYGEFEVTD